MGNESYVLAQKITQKKYNLASMINLKFFMYHLNDPKKLINVIFSNKIFYGMFNKTIPEVKETEGIKKIITELIMCENKNYNSEKFQKEFKEFNILYYMPSRYLEYLDQALLEYYSMVNNIDLKRLPFGFEEKPEAYLMELGLFVGRKKIEEMKKDFDDDKNESSIYSFLYNKTKEKLKKRLETKKLEIQENIKRLDSIVESENIALSNYNSHSYINEGELIDKDIINEDPSVILPDYNESDIKPKR